MCWRTWIPVVAAGVAAWTTLSAQQPAQQDATQEPAAAFRADVNFVEVPTIVTDEDDNFVEGLTIDDFTVLEDGELQTITVFELIDLPTERPFTPIYADAPAEPDVYMARPSMEGRLYVLLLDDLHTAVLRTKEVQLEARRFVIENLYDGDIAAVAFTSGRAEGQELTTRRSLLLAAIGRFEGRKLPSQSGELLGMHLGEQYETDMIRDLRDDPNEPQGRPVTRDMVLNDEYDTERALNARRLLETVERVAQWMGDLRGRRKALVLFTEGFDYDIYAPFARQASRMIRDARDAIAAAQRANVSIYAVDARGLLQVPGEAINTRGLSNDPSVRAGSILGYQRELLMAQEGLLTLAAETGGLAVINTNDVQAGLDRVVGDSSTYYLLGYATDPDRRESDDFRRIEVQVNRPDVRVRARRGFVLGSPEDEAELRAERREELGAGAEASAAWDAAVGTPLPIGDVQFRVTAAPFMSDEEQASVLVTAELDGSTIGFEEVDGLFRGRVELSVLALNYRGELVDGDTQNFDLNLRPQTWEAVRNYGVRVYTRLDLPAAARYQLRVGAHDAVGGTSGVVPFDVEVPDYKETPLALSGLVITSNSAALTPTPQPDTELASLFPTPPSANRSFVPQETLGVFVELYAREASRRRVEFAATVRDASDGRTVYTQRDDRSLRRTDDMQIEGYAVEIPLRDLVPGTYMLRTEALIRDETDIVAFREIPFDVR